MEDRVKYMSYLFMAVMIGIALFCHLLPAAIAGFTVYLITESVSQRLVSRMSSHKAKAVALVIISLTVISALTGMIFFIASFMHGGNDNFSLLAQKLISVLDELKNILPAGIHENMPKTALELKDALSNYLHEHSETIGEMGKHGLKQMIHIIMGMVVGAIISFYHFIPHHLEEKPLIRALKTRIFNFSDSFKKVVFSQVKISAINTVLTGLFLGVILPLCGIHLPYVKTLVLITFLAGLIPVLGNLISNTIIFLVALGVSTTAGIAAIVFLIVVHKLEYFVNAKIVGDQIKATAWELLLTLIIMETMFGINGIILGPILYAYIKNELTKAELI